MAASLRSRDRPLQRLNAVLGDHGLRHAHLRADRDVGVLGDVLGGRIHVGDVDVVELGNRGMMRAPYSAEFARPAASATVRLAWIWMGDWFMLQTVTKI
jgi:hypothetical protein